MKAKHYSRHDKRIRHHLKLVIFIYGAIITTIYTVVYTLKSSHSNNILIFGIAAGVIILGSLLVLLVEHGLALDILIRFVSRFHKNIYVGYWEVVISYKDSSGAAKSRTTHFHLMESATGFLMDGKEIYESGTSVVEVDRWHADKVELLTYDNKKVLIYTYFTFNDTDLQPTKIGLVTAICMTNKFEFKGSFKDFVVDEEQAMTREGQVHIKKLM